MFWTDQQEANGNNGAEMISNWLRAALQSCSSFPADDSRRGAALSVRRLVAAVTSLGAAECFCRGKKLLQTQSFSIEI